MLACRATPEACPMDDKYPLCSMNEVVKMIGTSRTFVNKMRAAGRVPRAVRVGDKKIAFVRSEVREWINERIAARDQRVAGGA